MTTFHVFCNLLINNFNKYLYYSKKYILLPMQLQNKYYFHIEIYCTKNESVFEFEERMHFV